MFNLSWERTYQATQTSLNTSANDYKTPQLLILVLQIYFSDQANLQIWNLQTMRVDVCLLGTYVYKEEDSQYGKKDKK